MAPSSDSPAVSQPSKTSSGVHYFQGSAHFRSTVESQYAFQVFCGPREIAVEGGDCCFYLSSDKREAVLARGNKTVKSEHFATIIRGYAPPDKRTSISVETNLPYVNGCSARQLFHPERPGDPTWQLLRMPAFTSEQIHHIHTTARAVYILQGKAVCVVGMGKNVSRHPLVPGLVCVFESMCPHHFETTDEELIALPVHVWSTTSGAESNHPMFLGTIPVNHA